MGGCLFTQSHAVTPPSVMWLPACISQPIGIFRGKVQTRAPRGDWVQVRVLATTVLFSALPSYLHSMEKPKWASDHNLEVCGQYYQGFVDDYKAVLSQHCMATVTTYGVRKSRTNASAGTDQEKENEAGNTIQTSEVSINKGHNYINIHSDNKSLCLNSQKIRIYWQKKEGCKTIEFNNIPFSVAEEKLLDCQFGPKYFKQKPVQGKRLWLQSTRKIGCNAHVEVKAFTL